jgi:hypothetical protein
MSKKNNLNFNNLNCQTSISKLYNLNYNSDYIIYKIKQKGTKCTVESEVGCLVHKTNQVQGDGGVDTRHQHLGETAMQKGRIW